MTRSNCRWRSGRASAGLFALIAGFIGLPAARAQPFERPQQQAFRQPVMPPGDGTEGFRALFDAAGITPVPLNEMERFRGDPNLIVVVIGDPRQGQFNGPTDWARQAVQNGGGVLVASDSRYSLFTSGAQPDFVGRFTGQIVYANDQNPRDTHAQREGCPFAVPVSPDETGADPKGRVWNVFRGLTKVATNHPTYIEMPLPQGEYKHALARLPRSAFLQFGGRFQDPPLFAVGNDGPATRRGPGYSFLAVADHSAYINQMLLEPGTDNRQLAWRTVQYLRGPDGERKRCLFFENGRVVERFDDLRTALTPPPPPVPPAAMPDLGQLIRKHQDKLINILDAKADELQQNDVLHRSLVGPEGSERERRSAANWVDRTLVFASIAIVFFLLRKMWGVRHPQDAPPAPNTGAGAASTGPPGVFNRRQTELVRRNNLYEPVKALVRGFFTGAGAPENPGPRMPRLEITAAVRKPDSLRQAIRDLWRLAYGPPTALTAQRWYELEPYFERLKQAHADGKWRFVLESVPGSKFRVPS